MIFYSEEKGHYSHMVRIVLAEKDIACEIKEFDPEGKLPEELPTINPYNKLPVLVDREVTIYEPRVILEYLDNNRNSYTNIYFCFVGESTRSIKI